MPKWENLIQMMRHTEDAQDGSSIDKTHYMVLYALTRICQPVEVVEIGSRRGGSAMWICRAMEENGRGTLHCIDPFIAVHGGAPGFLEHFHRNLKELGLDHRVKLIKKLSDDALDEIPEEIDFLFIDGDHSEEQCRKDIVNYVPRVTSEGVVIIHDSRSEPGVTAAIKEQENLALVPFFDFEVSTYHGLWVGIKV